MLLKELSKSTRIIAKDLVSTPVGMLCYVVDGLKSGHNLSEIMDKVKEHNQSIVLLDHLPSVAKAERNLNNIQTVQDVYNLC